MHFLYRNKKNSMEIHFVRFFLKKNEGGVGQKKLISTFQNATQKRWLRSILYCYDLRLRFGLIGVFLSFLSLSFYDCFRVAFFWVVLFINWMFNIRPVAFLIKFVDCFFFALIFLFYWGNSYFESIPFLKSDWCSFLCSFFSFDL